MREIRALWHRNPRVIIVFAALPALLVVLCVVLASVLTPRPVDPNSPEAALQITPDANPLAVTAQDVVDYFQKQGMILEGLRPFRYQENGLNAAQAFFFTLPGTGNQNAAVMSYDDISSQQKDAARFPKLPELGIAIVADGTTLPTSTPQPTIQANPLNTIWNMDAASNVLLLTTKNFDQDVRAALVSHLMSMTFAPVRSNWPTATPGPTATSGE